MTTPKVLPWFARKAGLDDASALRLWRRAVGESADEGGSKVSAIATTMSRFLKLLDTESAARTV